MVNGRKGESRWLIPTEALSPAAFLTSSLFLPLFFLLIYPPSAVYCPLVYNLIPPLSSALYSMPLLPL
jgi:hypothetical protein